MLTNERLFERSRESYVSFPKRFPFQGRSDSLRTFLCFGFLALLVGLPGAAFSTPKATKDSKLPTFQRGKPHVKLPGWKRLDLRPKLPRVRRVAQAQPPKVKLSKTKLPPATPLLLPKQSLQQVYQLAKKSNVDLRILKQNLVLAEIASARAWIALRPRVGLSGSYNRNQFEVIVNTGPNTSAVITPKDRFDLGVQMSWTFMDFTTIPNVQVAALSKKLTGKTVQQTKRELYYSISRTYYSVLLAEGTLRSARESWQNALQHLEISQARLQAGMTTNLATMQAKLDVARAQQSWFNARNQLRNTKLTLALLLGLKTFPYSAQRPNKPNLPSGKMGRWLELARKQRTELASKRLSLAIATKKLQSQWLTYLPTATLSGGVSLTNATGFAGQAANWSLGVSLQWALYNGGARTSAIREGYANLRKAQLDYQKEQQAIDNEVRKAYLDLQNATMAVDIARRNAELAEQTYRLRQQRYKAGMATPVSVSDANTLLLNAKINMLRESLNRELIVLRLRRAVGQFLVK